MSSIKKEKNSVKVLISPAHYILDSSSQSEFYAAARVIEDITVLDRRLEYYVICGKCKQKEKLGKNVKVIEVLSRPDLKITLWLRIRFYFLVMMASMKVLKENKVDVIWHMLPNGLLSFNLIIFFQIDKLFNKNLRRVIGRLQYTDLPDMKNILENDGKTLHQNNSALELFLFGIIKNIMLFFSRYYFNLFDFYIFNNNVARDYFRKKLKRDFRERSYAIIPVGVDVDTFTFNEKILTGKIRLLFAGNLTDNKRVEVVLRISHYLMTNGYNFVLDVVGDGDEMDDLVSLSRKLGIGDRVYFHGAKPKSDMPSIFGNAHMVFLLSKSESFGQVLLEAWAAGTLFIGSNIPVFNEIISDGENGILVDVDNGRYEDFAKRIMHISQEDYSRMVRKGLQSVKKYEWRNIARRYYENIFI